MRTRITLLAQPKSMRSTIDATRQEPRHGSACNWCVNRNGDPAGPHPAPVAPLADQSGQRNERGVGFKVAKWGMFFYPKTLQSRPARLK